MADIDTKQTSVQDAIKRGKEFPKYKYHANRAPVIVGDAKAEEDLGDEWYDSPAEFGIITAPSTDQLFDMETKRLDDFANPVDAEQARAQREQLVAQRPVDKEQDVLKTKKQRD